MDHAKQSPEAAKAMTEAATKNINCIECHKGIAHELPNMAGGFQKDFEKPSMKLQQHKVQREQTLLSW
ncbi:NapC/NirT family cytochrome c [Photobacterium leiognathi]|uniref:NapC/NirT family cytochrome c n=1 Tax=Photobacterium leiognathi TaxID=553611 RepID=UPI002738B38A|nr:NapC/NirT family cytochrome c [Photobacterium leiognathi]